MLHHDRPAAVIGSSQPGGTRDITSHSQSGGSRPEVIGHRIFSPNPFPNYVVYNWQRDTLMSFFPLQTSKIDVFQRCYYKQQMSVERKEPFVVIKGGKMGKKRCQ